MLDWGWVEKRLNRKFMLGNAAGILVSSLVFLFLYLGMYQGQLSAERGNAATQVNQLLETSLENAMLKRDLDGLRHIVERLGAQEEILNVMILNPQGEVRFTSDPDMLGRRFDRARDATCTGCHAYDASTSTAFVTDDSGRAVLRSVNPVRNKPKCIECHGPVSQHPVNGVLFVDYDAAPIEMNARRTTLALVVAGVCVLMIVLLGGAWFMRRFVLRPVSQLHATSSALSAGQLDARVDIPGTDELAELGQCFNGMAESLAQSLERLREKEVFLQSLVDAVPDGLRVIDQDYRIILANRAYCQQLGVSDDAVRGQRCFESSHSRSEPCAPTMVTCPLAQLRHQQEPIKCLHRHRRQDGNEIDVEIFAAPMRVPHRGKMHQFVVESVRDLDAAVQYSHEQKLSELGRLAAGVAHEIHNPLTSVKMLLTTLERLQGNEGDRQEEIRNCLQLVDQEVERCVEITGRLLKLSVYSGVQTQVVSVNEAVRETVSLLKWDAGQAGIAIVEELDASNPRVLARESDFRMVILNLVQNAFHAMPRGGILTLRSRRGSGHICVDVVDNGVGIDDAVVARIFDPFFSRRADGTSGTGLGLSISRANVERDGGRIAVESVMDQGSTFTVSFPDPEN